MPEMERHDELLHVLTVEDNALFRDGLKTLFDVVARQEQIGFTFDEAVSGEEAIEKVKQKDYNIIFMDYNLGSGLNGAETIIRILRLKPQIKILGFSSHTELVLVQDMIDAGARGYLIKNFHKGELLAAVKAVLSGEIYYCRDISDMMKARWINR